MRWSWLSSQPVDPSWRWHDLATYNAEVSRGIVHTAEYDERMAAEQERFDAEHNTSVEGVRVLPPFAP